MAVPEVSSSDIPGWVIGLGAALITGASGFIVGLINRGPTMQLAVNAAIQPQLVGYKDRVEELVAEVHALRKEVVRLGLALDQANIESRNALRQTNRNTDAINVNTHAIEEASH